jgi:hypothetical protein
MIVKLQGGLANQMFQYAFGVSVAKARGEQVFFDKSSFDTDPLRHYELDQYDLMIAFCDGNCRGPVYKEKSLLFDPEVYQAERGTKFEGYWQHPRYVDSQVYSLFRKPKGTPNFQVMPKVIAAIEEAPSSCFLGVRRADYLWPERINYHGVMPVEYYQEAVKLIPPNTRIFVFTDDIPWCLENLPYDIVDANGPNEKAWDIWLMSLSDHAIIANSTFHWWGAYLGPDKRGGTIVAPKKWFAADIPNQIVPERWKTL